MKLLNPAVYAALLAAGPGIISLSSTTDASAALEVEQYNSALFVSGGVGEEERLAIEKLSLGYSLELLFATKSLPNQYLADVKVQIKDRDGKVVLDTVSQGPFLLAKVPPGRYSISADSDGRVKQQTVQVTGATPNRIVFLW